MRKVALLFNAIIVAIGCGSSLESQTVESVGGAGDGNSHTFKMEVWGDNWFGLYFGDTLLKEDSVSITAERSFNAESFTFQTTYPLQLKIIAKDFKENDTELEDIGTRRQQMGDGGIIAQITDVNTGKVIVATNNNWKALVIHKAPLDSGYAQSSNPTAGIAPCEFESIEEPENWKSPDFKDNNRKSATEHTARAVRPKDGYDRISRSSSARIIWGADLEKGNTILLRYSVLEPN